MFKRALRVLISMLSNEKGIVSVGGGYDQSSTKTTKARPDFLQQPDYAESEGARKDWWAKLQEFGGQPGYGAIAPDWAAIWDNAQKKVKQYFWGSPTDPGMVNKVKASAARRGVSESPAMENSLARMGATEANVFSDMATQEATNKAQFAEEGRQGYLQNLMQLAGLQTQGTWFSPWTKTDSSGWNVKGSVGTKPQQ